MAHKVRLLRQANMTLSVHFRKIFGYFCATMDHYVASGECGRDPQGAATHGMAQGQQCSKEGRGAKRCTTPLATMYLTSSVMSCITLGSPSSSGARYFR